MLSLSVLGLAGARAYAKARRGLSDSHVKSLGYAASGTIARGGAESLRVVCAGRYHALVHLRGNVCRDTRHAGRFGAAAR